MSPVAVSAGEQHRALERGQCQLGATRRHRRRDALQDQGLVTRLFTERIFTRTWSEVFSSEHPLDPAAAAVHYRALRHGDPARDVQRRLLAYIPERVAQRARLEGALAGTDVPLHFLWGMQDPVSGAQIASSLRRRFDPIDLVEYPDAGHVPHLEIPDRVAADILARSSP